MDDKKFQEEIKDSVHKIWLAGLGAVAMTEEEGGKFLKNLVEKGEAFEDRNRERFDGMRDKAQEAAGKAKSKAEDTFGKVEEKFDDAVAAAMRRLGVPSREEIATLTRRVEELTAVVEQLRPTKKPPAKKASAEAAAN